MPAQSGTTRTRRDGSTPIFEDVKKAAEIPVSPVAQAPGRSQRARDYEEKVSGLFNLGMKATAGHPAMVADAAALIVHGPMVASKAGDLADEDPRVRRAIDFITSGTDNPYAALVMASIPLIVQIARNHETEAPVKVGLKIPFTQRTIRIPFKLKLKNPFLRSLTQKPEDLAASVFNNEGIKEALIEQRVEVAWAGYRGTE